MTSPSTSHIERTATEPRDAALHEVVICRVTDVDDHVRLLKLAPPDHRDIEFLPGQWLDVYVPNIPKPGGFTITSTPADARTLPRSSAADERSAWLELAIQDSPQNPVAAWLWRPVDRVVGAVLQVRVGGRFVWPPPAVDVNEIRRIVFLAGGVGINPLISMLENIVTTEERQVDVVFLYSVKSRSRHAAAILFLERLAALISKLGSRARLSVFLTGQDSRVLFTSVEWR